MRNHPSFSRTESLYLSEGDRSRLIKQGGFSDFLLDRRVTTTDTLFSLIKIGLREGRIWAELSQAEVVPDQIGCNGGSNIRDN